MRMGRDFLAGSRKHEKLCLDLIMEERGQARSGLREKLQPGVSDSRDPGSSRGLEGENVRKIKGESGLSAIELAQLRGFAKFLPELRARKPKRKPKFNWVGDLKNLRDHHTAVELQHKNAEWKIRAREGSGDPSFPVVHLRIIPYTLSASCSSAGNNIY